MGEKESDGSLSICRVEILIGDDWEPAGTGFLVARGIVLTNYHVIFQVLETNGIRVWINPEKLRFRFEYLERDGGMLEVGLLVRCRAEDALVAYAESDPGELEQDADFEKSGGTDLLDFALIRINLDHERCWVPTKLVRGRSTPTELYIIQHPRGVRQEQACTSKPWIINKQGVRVGYDLDTDIGSSGSPVFDQKDRLVALHNAHGRGVPIDAICKFLEVETLSEFDAASRSKSSVFLSPREALLRQIKNNWIQDYGGRFPSVEHDLPITVHCDGGRKISTYSSLALREVEDPASLLGRFYSSQVSLSISGDDEGSQGVILMELMSEMHRRAMAVEHKRIPVVFQATGWLQRSEDLPRALHERCEAELISQLQVRYYVPRKIAESFIRNNQITVFIDGFFDLLAESADGRSLDTARDLLREVGAWADKSHSRQLFVVIPGEWPPELKELGDALVMSGGMWEKLEVQPIRQADAKGFLAENLKLNLQDVSPLFDSESFRKLTTRGTFLQSFLRAAGGTMESRVAFVSTLAKRIHGEPAIGEESLQKSVLDRWMELALTAENRSFDKESIRHSLEWIATNLAERNRLFYLDRVQPTWLKAVDPKRDQEGLEADTAKALADYLRSCAFSYGLYLGVITAFVIFLSLLFEWWSSRGYIAMHAPLLAAGIAGVGVVILAAGVYRSTEQAWVFGAVLGLAFGWARGVNLFFSVDSTGAFQNGALTAVISAAILAVIFGLRSSSRVRVEFVDVKIRYTDHGAWALLLLPLLSVGLIWGHQQFWGAAGLSFAVASCAILALTVRSTGVPSRTRPNEGFRSSLRLSLLFSGACTVLAVVGLGAGFLVSGGGWPAGRVSAGVNAILGFAMMTTAVLFGLQPVIQQLQLRRVLRKRRAIPWRLGRLLDFCVSRGILVRIGGAYLFVTDDLRRRFSTLD